MPFDSAIEKTERARQLSAGSAQSQRAAMLDSLPPLCPAAV